MSRIALLEPPYTDEAGARLARMMPGGAASIGLFRMFARNLPMVGAMHEWGRYELGRQLTLSMREREIVIDRTCARCGCEYEWGRARDDLRREGRPHPRADGIAGPRRRAARVPHEPGAPRFADILPAGA